MNQDELRASRPEQITNNTVTLVTTFNPNNPSINSLIQTGLTMLKTSPRLKIILGTTNIIHSKRQPRNLKQL